MQLYQRFRHPNPAISIAYDALNRPTNMVDAVGTTSYGYDAVGQLLSEDGPWASDSVAYGYTARMRTSLSLQQPNADPWNQTYGYDSARRLTSTASPAGSFGYAYDPNRKLRVSDLSLPNTANITNAYDANARLLGTVLVNSGGTNLDAYTYTYNVGNQRTTVTRTLGDVVSYGYDGISQLTSASAKELGGVTNRLQEQFGYGYDAAHNLEFRTNNALIQTFNVNSLNELTTVTRNSTNALTVAGTTGAKATSVTVNGLFASTYNDSTFAEGGFTPVDGNNTYTAIAQDALGRQSTNSVTVFLPASATYTYDLNGNLLSDGTRGFNYDDENQLTNVLVTNAWMSQFVYDGRLRRRIRKEFAWQGGAWVETNEVHYVYDGNLVIQERDINNLPTTTYTRGNDLSGSLQGAGGIGGLLARSDMTVAIINPTGAHAYYHSDGNGNITAMINLNQALAAKYLYDPFGNLLALNGQLAKDNIYRFSSCEQDDKSCLSCYLYRFYDSHLQRWINRDPIGESGGRNLYAFFRNDLVDYIDIFGLAGSVTHGTVSCQPGDDCATLAAKIEAWSAHLNERIDELIIDKKALKTTNPQAYNNHVAQAFAAANNLSRCYSLFQDHQPPCCQKPSNWTPRTIPSYVDTSSTIDKILIHTPGSDNLWIGIGKASGYTGEAATALALGGWGYSAAASASRGLAWALAGAY